MYICPDCQKQLKSKRSLEQHRVKYHGGQPAAPASSDAAELEIQPPAADTGDTVYQCSNCGGKVSKGMPACPGCGLGLNWEGL